MRVAFVLMILLMPIMAAAQKLDKPQIDKISNDTLFSTKWETISSTEKFTSDVAEILQAYVSKLNSTICFNFSVEATTKDHQYFSVSKGGTGLIKLADNSIISLSNVKDVQATRHKIGTSLFVERLYWTANLTYCMSDEDIKKITSSTITTIRVEADDRSFDFDIKPKDSDVIKKMIALVISAK